MTREKAREPSRPMGHPRQGASQPPPEAERYQVRAVTLQGGRAPPHPPGPGGPGPTAHAGGGLRPPIPARSRYQIYKYQSQYRPRSKNRVKRCDSGPSRYGTVSPHVSHFSYFRVREASIRVEIRRPCAAYLITAFQILEPLLSARFRARRPPTPKNSPMLLRDQARNLQKSKF